METNPQVRLLNKFSGVAEGTPAVFEVAQRARDAHQRRLNEQLEDTLRQIQTCRSHMQQKYKHVRDTTSSFVSKFEHDLSVAREGERGLQRDLESCMGKVDGALDGLDTRLDELDEDLRVRKAHRIQHIEETLGPIRDEVRRLDEALKEESRSRRLEEQRREKRLLDEVEAFTGLVDAEKFARERQLAALGTATDTLQQKLAKQLYQEEKRSRDTEAALRVQLHKETKDRVDGQQRVIESIAAFVQKYRGQVMRELEVTADAHERAQASAARDAAQPRLARDGTLKMGGG